METQRLIIIGLNLIGRHLVKVFSEEFNITCIEFNSQAIEETKKEIQGSNVQFVHGDATSRLTLQLADVDNAFIVIIAMTTERVDLEVARVLRTYFNVNRIISIGITPKGCETLEAMDVEVENIFSATANSLRNRVLKTAKTAQGIGLGIREILELELHPRSRLANKILGSIDPIHWRIGIIYRNGNIVVPRYDTVLMPKDKIVILGEPSVLKTVSELMSFEFVSFPSQYGTTAIAYLTGHEEASFFKEIQYLFNIFQLRGIIFLLAKKGSEFSKSIKDLIEKEITIPFKLKTEVSSIVQAVEQTVEEINGQCGLLIFSKRLFISPLNSFLFPFAKKQLLLSNLISVAKCPILLASSTFPYNEVAVPVIKGTNTEHLLEDGMEIAQTLDREITAIFISPSKYIATEEEVQHFDKMKKLVSNVGLVYKKKIKTITGKGNPIVEITKHLKDFNLLIIEMTKPKRFEFLSNFFNPDVSWHVIRGAGISTMILPLVEESL